MMSEDYNPYIPIIKVKPLTLKHDPGNDVSACLVNYQWPDIGEYEDHDMSRYKTAMLDCSSQSSCAGCLLDYDMFNLDYLLDKGYITKANALELTLSGMVGNAERK